MEVETEASSSKRKAKVLGRSKDFTVTVYGAGQDCVNGKYYCSGQNNNVKKYLKLSVYKGKEQPFVIYRNKQCKQWLLSLVPGNLKPGSVCNDHNFYHANATGIDNELPPVDGWKICPVHPIDKAWKKDPDGIPPPPKLSYPTDKNEVKQPSTNANQSTAGTTTLKTTDDDEVLLKLPSRNSSQFTAGTTRLKTIDEDEVHLKQPSMDSSQFTAGITKLETTNEEGFLLKQPSRNSSQFTAGTTRLKSDSTSGYSTSSTSVYSTSLLNRPCNKKTESVLDFMTPNSTSKKYRSNQNQKLDLMNNSTFNIHDMKTTFKTTDEDEVLLKQPSRNSSQFTAGTTRLKTTDEDEVLLIQPSRNSGQFTAGTTRLKTTDEDEVVFKQSTRDARQLTAESATSTTNHVGCIICNDILQLICSHKIDPDNRLFYQLTAMKHWDHHQTCDAIKAYSEFMTLKIVNKDYDGTILSPTKVIDEVWHSHVMDTKAYLSFNSTYVKDGNFIHHDPLKAMDVKGREVRCKKSIEQYRSYFGRPIPKDSKAWFYESLVEESKLSKGIIEDQSGRIDQCGSNSLPIPEETKACSHDSSVGQSKLSVNQSKLSVDRSKPSVDQTESLVDQNEPVVIYFSTQDNKVTECKVRLSTRAGKLLQTIAHRENLDYHGHYVCDGERIDWDRSLYSNGVRSGDTIYHMINQLGC